MLRNWLALRSIIATAPVWGVVMALWISFGGLSGAWAQGTGSLGGLVTDGDDKLPLIGVNVVIKGSSLGSSSNLDGRYLLNKIPTGTYQVEVTYLGYEKKVFTGIRIRPNQTETLNIVLRRSAVTMDQEVVVVGDKPLIDLEQTRTEQRIGQESIEAAPSRSVQSVLNTQAGVMLNPEGLSIRGGRTYETAFVIDGVSATDPLAGTGFGIDLGTNSIDKMEIATGGGDVAQGDGSAGIVRTRTRSGGDRWAYSLTARSDRLGVNNNWNSVWNNQVYEGTLGGTIRGLFKQPLRVFTSFKGTFDDQYFRTPAQQVKSSLYPTTGLSPMQDNRWAGMLKLDYAFHPGLRLSGTYLRSLTINQDVNMLRIIGNDAPFLPGYQFEFALQPDNALTYTHDTNLESLQLNHTTSKRFSYTVNASRLYVRLRADANGRDWRPDEVDSEFDPNSIVTFPVTYFNPGDSQVFVNPGPGLYNNGGIGTLWHDHYVLEYTVKASGNYYYNSRGDRLIFGGEFKDQDLQWVDIIRPWIGAPIPLADGTFSQSFRLGDYSDVWRVQPKRGAFFVSNKLKYLGLVAEAGLRLEYWMPGSFVDNAVGDARSPIRDEIRADYLQNTFNVMGLRTKARLLPKLSASFPIRENQVLYFNYNHAMVMPHPSWMYQGLNPLYQDRSVLARVGNPDLNPEMDISYELGLRTQLTPNDALTVTAYWKDKYDFITAASTQIRDFTGREVTRTLRINSDYARIRGLELGYFKRIGNWFQSQVSAAYMVARGQSSSASEALTSILNTGNRQDTKETFLAWDAPYDIKGNVILTLDRKRGLWGSSFLNHWSLYLEGVLRSGRRYTPFTFQGVEPVSGRPIYERDPRPEALWSALGESQRWMDFSLRKWWNKGDFRWEFSLQVTNLMNRLNAIIPNPVTGRAWEPGDPVPSSWRDPAFLDPRDARSRGLPPDNPARYMAPRHFMLGIALKYR